MHKAIIVVPPLVVMVAVACAFIFSGAPFAGREAVGELCAIAASAVWIIIGKLLVGLKSKDEGCENDMGTLTL